MPQDEAIRQKMRRLVRRLELQLSHESLLALSLSSLDLGNRYIERLGNEGFMEGFEGI